MGVSRKLWGNMSTVPNDNTSSTHGVVNPTDNNNWFVATL